MIDEYSQDLTGNLIDRPTESSITKIGSFIKNKSHYSSSIQTTSYLFIIMSDPVEYDANLEKGIPEYFICPLTLEVMEDPLMDRRGNNFEHKAIVEWLNRGKKTCPLTREPLAYSKLISNVPLRMRIERWKKDHGINVTSTYNMVHRDSKNSHSLLCVMDAPSNSLINIRLNGNRLSSSTSVVTTPRSRIVEARRQNVLSILDSALSVVRGSH
jgi:hypothetical protein